jgi:hypothetical protein
MTIEYLEYDDKPFAFDKDSWTLYRMDGPNRDEWVEIDNADRCVKIRFESWVIPEAEARKLARDLKEEEG